MGVDEVWLFVLAFNSAVRIEQVCTIYEGLYE